MTRTLLVLAVMASTLPLFAQRPEPAPPSPFADKVASWEAHQRLAKDSLFTGLEWRSVGPVVQGGRVVDIEPIPGAPLSYYVAYASGGLWRTDNNGHTFTPLFDEQPTLIMGDVEVDPSNPSRVWVGTGENNSSRSSYGGHGVFLSTDAGSSWQSMGLGETDRIGGIAIDPRDGNRVYVAALGKLYTESGERGLFRTEDGGKSWTRVLGGDAVNGGGYTGAIDVEIDPSNPDVIYAALWERSRRPWNFVEAGPGSGVWKSTDRGESWTRLSGGLPRGEDVGRIELALCASKPQTLYVCIDNQEVLPEAEWDLGGSAVNAKRLRGMSKEEFLAQDPEAIESFIRGNDLETALDAETLIEKVENDELTIADILAELDDANANLFQTDIRGLEVYRTDDGGATWRRTHDEPLHEIVYTYGYYFGLMEVDPLNADRIYVAGVPLVRSEDGGKTWKNIMSRDMHVDHHAVWIDPQVPGRVVVGNDGGLDASYDYGETWRSVDTQAVGQFYTVEVDMASPYNIYGGTQDNGTLKGSSRSRPAINKWSFIGGGDGMYVQIDPRDGTTYYGYQFGFYTRRDPNGSTHTVRPRDALGETSYRYNWATPIQLSKHHPGILYFGTNQLLRSMDKGETWEALSGDLTTAKERGDVPFACVTTVDESPEDFGLIWVGTDDGHVHVTETHGKSWRNASQAFPRDRWVTRVIASRVERERAYVTLNGYRDDDVTAYVYVTEDLGKTWRSIAKGLPAAPVNVIREDPVNDDVLYVGTDRGCYVSLDRGANWDVLASGIPVVPVHDLVVHPRERELVAGTHGRSIYVVDVLPIQELDSELRDADLHVFPIEKIRASRGWRSRRSRWFYRPDYDPYRWIRFWSKGAGTVTLELVDEDDRVLWSREETVERGVSSFRWDLLVDEAPALAAEAARNAPKDDGESDGEEGADGESSDTSEAESDSKGSLAKTPWAESKRLGHPLYVLPGKYTIRVRQGEAESTTEFKVDAPTPRSPRMKKKPKIRGEK